MVNYRALWFFLIAIVFVLNSCSLIKLGEEKEWQPLFNGKNLDGWIAKFYHHELGDNYANTFRVEEGILKVSYDDYKGFGERYGHLFYNESFSSFHLKFEYRFTDQWIDTTSRFTFRNSGVMFHSQAPETILKEQNWPISVEFQLLAEKEDQVSRPTGNVCSPGTDVFYNGEMDPRHCIRSSSKNFKYDEWVLGELIVYSDSLIKHVINGDTVLRYTKPMIGGGGVKGFDPNIKIDGKPLKEGYIGLQAEGQGIEFKNIRIKNLDSGN